MSFFLRLLLAPFLFLDGILRRLVKPLLWFMILAAPFLVLAAVSPGWNRMFNRLLYWAIAHVSALYAWVRDWMSF